MSWHNLEYNIKRLTHETVNNVFENIDYIRDAAVDAGLTVRELTAVNAQMNTLVKDVRETLLSVENDLTILNTDVTRSLYYEGPREAGSYMTLSAYHRWVLILNDLYDIVINGNRQWGMVYLIPEENQPALVQIDGKYVYIRGNYIG